MLILKNVKINNFISHSDTEITFQDNTKMLLDGKSGSGKSSIVDAIIWGLYGVARVDNRSLVQKGETTTCVAITILNDTDNTFYRVTRKTTDKAKNTLEVDSSNDGLEWTPIEKTGLRDIQNWIERDLIHASYTLFVNSIAYPQDNVNSFVNQIASKRKDLLLEIANVTEFDLYYVRAREMLTLKNEEKIRLTTKIESAQKLLQVSSESIVDEQELENKIAEISRNLETYKVDLEILLTERIYTGDVSSQISKLKIQIADSEREQQALNKDLIAREEIIKKIESIDINELKTKIAEGESIKDRKEVLEVKSQKEQERTGKLLAVMSDRPADRDYDSEIMELNTKLIPLIKETGTCPSGDACPFTIPIKSQIKYLEEKISEKMADKAKLDVAKAEYSQKILDLGPSELSEEEKGELVSLRSQTAVYGSYTIQYSHACTSLDALPSLKGEYTACEEKIRKIGTVIADLNLELSQKEEMQKGVDVSAFATRESDLRQKIYQLGGVLTACNHQVFTSKETRSRMVIVEKEISDDTEALNKLSELIESLATIKEALGSRGLKTVVIDYLLPRLEEKINEILARLSDFRVRLDTQKTSSDGEGVIEGLFINIFNEKGEQLEFSSYSGGEKLKISVAISEALASLQRCGFRLFDELFIGLDEESIEHFADVMNQLQDKFKQMICISHLRTIKDLFDDKITVVKINGVSKLYEKTETH